MGPCPFCELDPNEEVIRRWKYWWVKANKFPYKGLGLHLLVIPHEHLTDIQALTGGMSGELVRIIQWVERFYGVQGGGVLMRFGDPKQHGGSQPHLHVHIMVPDGTVDVKKLFYQERA